MIRSALAVTDEELSTAAAIEIPAVAAILLYAGFVVPREGVVNRMANRRRRLTHWGT